MQAIALIFSIAAVGGDFPSVSPPQTASPTQRVAQNSQFPTNRESIESPRRNPYKRSIARNRRDLAASPNATNLQSELDASTRDLIVPVQYQDTDIPSRPVDGLMGRRNRAAATDPTTADGELRPILPYTATSQGNEAALPRSNDGPKLPPPSGTFNAPASPYLSPQPNEAARRGAEARSAASNRDLLPNRSNDSSTTGGPDLNSQFIPATQSPDFHAAPSASSTVPRDQRDAPSAGSYPYGNNSTVSNGGGSLPQRQGYTPSTTYTQPPALQRDVPIVQANPMANVAPQIDPAARPIVNNRPTVVVPTATTSPELTGGPAETNAAAENSTEIYRRQFENQIADGGSRYFMTLLALFASVGLNLYLGWIAWDTYNRYQDLVADIRHGSRRERGERSSAEASAY